MQQRTLSSLDEMTGEASVIVNCAGLGARDLVGDASMQPIRGQIVRVRNPGLERFVLDEDNPEGDTYIVPRSHDCILGGTADEGEWDLEPDPRPPKASCAAAHATRAAPRGGRNLEHKVGLRPGRPAVRLESEGGPDSVPLIHNYGHGGSGVTLSWGCAEETLGLVREALDGQSVPVEA